MSRNFILRDLIDRVDWISIVTGNTRPRLGDEQVAVKFKNHKNIENNKIVHIRLGAGVLTKMGWQVGDKLLPMHDPDDIFSILLVKCETGAGRVLCAESNSHVARLQFTWQLPFNIKMKDQIVDFESYNQYLYFKLRNSE